MGEMAVFADTNLGTRIVVLVSPHITPNHFKREVERAHLNCFPQLGQIKVDAVMVEKNSCFYHLPETLPLKHVLKGFRPLVHVQVCQYGILEGFSTISGPIKLRTCTTGAKVEKLKCKRKLKMIKRFGCLKGALLRIVKKRKKRNNARKLKCLDEPLAVSMAYGCEGKEQSSDSSEAVSVSGIIRKYFSSHDEVNSHPFPHTPPSDHRASITTSKSKGIDIGSRIVSASKSLRSKRLLPSPAPLIPSLVFEMSDED